MASSKRLSTSYSITTPTTETITLNTHTVTVVGNLSVTGNVIQSNETVIYDNIITLNGNLTGTPAPTVKSGIEINRGSLTKTSLLFSEQTKTWQLTNDGSIYANIATVNSGAGTNTIRSVSEDPAPKITGNLNTNSSTIYSSSLPYIKFADNLAIQTTSVAPTAITSNTIIYASTVNSGGSGLYVANSNGNDELVTKTKAFVFSIIL